MHNEGCDRSGDPAARIDRRTWLRTTSLAGLAGLVSAGLTACGADRSAAPLPPASPTNEGQAAADRFAIDFLLRLEKLEEDLFERALASDLLHTAERVLFLEMKDHEREHASLLARALRRLGGSPVAKPAVRLPRGALDTREQTLRMCRQVEHEVVMGYQQKIPEVAGAELRRMLAAIAGTESKHAGISAQLAGSDPIPAATEASAPAAVVHGDLADLLEDVKG